MNRESQLKALSSRGEIMQLTREYMMVFKRLHFWLVNLNSISAKTTPGDSRLQIMQEFKLEKQVILNVDLHYTIFSIINLSYRFRIKKKIIQHSEV